MNTLALVLLQFVALFGLTLYSSIPGLNGLADMVSFSGILLGLWAMWEMRRSKYSVFPEVPRGATLVTSGPYAFIRHPMYLALLLYAIGRVINFTNSMTIFFTIVLLGLLVIKIQIEEAFLLKSFPKYKTFCKKTARLIPGLY